MKSVHLASGTVHPPEVRRTSSWTVSSFGGRRESYAVTADDRSSEQSSQQSGSESFGGEMSEVSSSYDTSSTSTFGGIMRKKTWLDRLDSVPTVAYMLLLLAIPVGIVVGTQAEALAGYQSSVRFFDNHKQVVHLSVECARDIQEEGTALSQVLASVSDPVLLGAAWALARSTREHSKEVCEILFHALTESQLPTTAHDTLRNALAEAEAVFGLVERGSIDEFEMRHRMQHVVHDIDSLLMTLSREAQLKEEQKDLHQLFLTRQWQSWIAYCRAAGTASMVLRENVQYEAHEELEECLASVEETVEILSATANEHGKEYLDAMSNSNEWETYVHGLATQDTAVWGYITLAMWEDKFDEVLDLMGTMNVHLIAIIDRAEELHQKTVAASIQMAVYASVCAVAAVFAIIMQRRFQHRMNVLLKRSQALSKAVSRFVPRNQLKIMGIRTITEIEPGDRVEVASTMLFVSIRKFEEISQKLTHVELYEWLQSYFARMTSVVEDNHGYLDKFIGDALFCVFGNPNDAVQCGIRMHCVVEQLNAELNSNNAEDLVDIGVGIHHGIVAAGVFGDESRLSCTLVSSDVNLASRLEGVTRAYGAKVVISEPVFERISEEAQSSCRCLGPLLVKGSLASLTVFEVFQADPQAIKRLKVETREDFEAAVKMAESDQDEASESLRRLRLRWQAAGLKDRAIEAKLHNLCELGSSIDQFSKRGSLLDSVASESSLFSPVGSNRSPKEQGLTSPLGSLNQVQQRNPTQNPSKEVPEEEGPDGVKVTKAPKPPLRGITSAPVLPEVFLSGQRGNQSLSPPPSPCQGRRVSSNPPVSRSSTQPDLDSFLTGNDGDSSNGGWYKKEQKQRSKAN